jgi:hypothetical protein
MAISFIRAAVIYFVAGVILGIYIGTNKLFQFAPVHAHINLLGWASLAIMGLLYHVFPKAGASKLAPWHFWIYNLGVIGFVAGLYLIISGSEAALPLVIASSNLVLVGVVLFLINVFVNVRSNQA